jgi:uncharacterized membrane protein
MLYIWLHLIALIVYLGAVIGFWLMLLPAVGVLHNHSEKLQLLARALKLNNLFSGAFQLTELKAAYRESFAKQIAFTLGIKLFFAFLLVIFSVYQALGIGHRFVRRHEAGEAVSPDQLSSIVRRLTSANWCILLLALITLWIGLRMRG